MMLLALVLTVVAPAFPFDEAVSMRVNQAHAAGISVWCDPTIPATHIGDYEY